MGREVNQNCSLKFFPPSIDSNGLLYAEIPRSEILINVDKWNNTLIGYVLGDKPFYSHLKGCVGRLWKPKCSLEIYSRENGFFFFKFGCHEELNRVLNGGPWLFDGRLIILKKWSENIGLERELLTSVPVWIRLPSLHLKLWSNNIISRIASLVGNPLYIDKATATGERLAYARCFVEISSRAKLPNSIRMDLGNGEWLETDVEYEWIPPKCNKCQNFGHMEYQCPVVIVEKWIPKSTLNVAEMEESMLVDNSLVNDNEHLLQGKTGLTNEAAVINKGKINVEAINSEGITHVDDTINADQLVTEVFLDPVVEDQAKSDEINAQEETIQFKSVHIGKTDTTDTLLLQISEPLQNVDTNTYSTVSINESINSITAGTSEGISSDSEQTTDIIPITESTSDQDKYNTGFIEQSSNGQGIHFPIATDNPEWLAVKEKLLMKKKNQAKVNKDSSGPKRVTRASTANIL
ncbi:uncharacterized protein LOC109841719 [Asparagus officinalis]|uniref:uncharacterized protein LOC109841719 n=1 Tax=Asparagus officinalis TaxID=4686 RepID=UPI00098E63BC|nr:uncharacterized protein LOC109841719 [Asparagus officinalis]